MSATIRSRGEIVLTVASSEIASLLIPGGRTVHSRFAIPIEVHESSTCNIAPKDPLADLIRRVKLIICDEAPMMHKHCFEVVDRTFQDIMQNKNIPFGGKLVVLGGDFRQILHVIPKGTTYEVGYSTINSSHLWSYYEVLTLTTNMRLLTGCIDADIEERKSFSEWILRIGDGSIGDANNVDITVQIPHDLLIPSFGDPLSSIVKNTSDVNMPDDVHTPEFLNTIVSSGLPNHKLRLKVGVPIMLWRNIDQSLGLCNGTRLIITKMGRYDLDGKIISGNNVGHKDFIPMLSLTPNDKRITFKFQRRQFPLTVSFAMTINKSQSQSLKYVGVYIPQSIFSHGQLYVALSRVTSKKGLKILITNNKDEDTNITENVVYK